jgi:hypothetical protein
MERNMKITLLADADAALKHVVLEQDNGITLTDERYENYITLSGEQMRRLVHEWNKRSIKGETDGNA